MWSPFIVILWDYTIFKTKYSFRELMLGIISTTGVFFAVNSKLILDETESD